MQTITSSNHSITEDDNEPVVIRPEGESTSQGKRQRKCLMQDSEVNGVHLIANLPMSPGKYPEIHKTHDTFKRLEDVILDGSSRNTGELSVEIREYW